jgi:hypothetical protein
MTLVDRVKNILLQPGSEWDKVAAEPATTADLYRGYIAPLAAISPIASFIGLSIVGIHLPFAGTYRIPIGSGIATAVLTYLAALAGVYVLALIINALAPTFGGEKNQLQALKAVAYSSTPGWIAGVLQVLPALGILALLASIYGIYLLYRGLPKLMKAPAERAGGYTTVVVLCAIGLSILLALVAGAGRHGAVSEMGNPAPVRPLPSQSSAPHNRLDVLGLSMPAVAAGPLAAQHPAAEAADSGPLITRGASLNA